MGTMGIHAIPLRITCMLQGTLCDTGIPCTYYGENICSVQSYKIDPSSTYVYAAQPFDLLHYALRTFLIYFPYAYFCCIKHSKSDCFSCQLTKIKFEFTCKVMYMQRDRTRRALLQYQNFDFLFYLGCFGSFTQSRHNIMKVVQS